MIVYLESNFILELAYLQEEHSNCEQILELSRADDAQLVLPAFAIAEPYSAWVGRKKRRGALHNELTRELRELGRSAPYAGSREEFQEITKALLVSGEDEKRRLDEAIEKVLQASILIPIEADTIRTDRHPINQPTGSARLNRVCVGAFPLDDCEQRYAKMLRH
jgi:hypothetical protein